MNFKCLILLSSFFYLHSLKAQVTISGRILSGTGNEPVSTASVYINNTTIGTTSKENGDYTLKGISPGVYEIIVSHVGFELVVYKVEVKSDDLRLTFRMEPKVKQMRDILVVTASQREKWLTIFKDNFLGQTVAASRSRIMNEDEIFFEKGPNRNIIRAFSEMPLIIENKELGYRIFFQLQEFYYDAQEGRTLFFGFTRYEELRETAGSVPGKYRRNREKTYRGSTLHFYHSLLADQLDKEGFSTYLTLPPDTSASVNKPDLELTGGTFKIRTGTPRLSVAVSRKDIFFTDSINRSVNFLRWKGTLQVRYRFNPYYKEALKRKIMVSGNLPEGFQSSVEMLESPAYLDANGLLINPLSVQYSGFWSYEKLANMLPINYRPEN